MIVNTLLATYPFHVTYILPVRQTYAMVDETERLISAEEAGPSTARKRNVKFTQAPSWAKGQKDYDPDLPYGPKVNLARKKKDDPWWVTTIEVTVVVGVLCFFVYMYYYIDHLHFHVTRAYAHIGSADAQHVLAHKYLAGRGTNKDEDLAMHYFKEAAKKGHPQASYNLVAGHMQGYNVHLEEEEIEQHLKTAHESGMEEATQALKDMFPHKY